VTVDEQVFRAGLTLAGVLEGPVQLKRKIGQLEEGKAFIHESLEILDGWRHVLGRDLADDQAVLLEAYSAVALGRALVESSEKVLEFASAVCKTSSTLRRRRARRPRAAAPATARWG